MSQDGSQDVSSDNQDGVDPNYLVERPAVRDPDGNVYEGQWYN